MDEDNMPMAFPNGNVYSLEVRVVVFHWKVLGMLTWYRIGDARDGGEE